MELTVEGDHLSGWYCSQKGRTARERKYAVSGLQNKELVAFHVSWQDENGNLAAITSFPGGLLRQAGKFTQSGYWFVSLKMMR